MGDEIDLKKLVEELMEYQIQDSHRVGLYCDKKDYVELEKTIERLSGGTLSVSAIFFMWVRKMNKKYSGKK
jgi:hypothetical protein